MNKAQSLKKRFLYQLRRHFLEILRTKNQTLGYAVGTFVALLPTPGFSTLIGLLVVVLFKRINEFAVFIALAVWNVWTATPIYYLGLQLGFDNSEMFRWILAT